MISFLFEVIKISTTNNWLIGPRESNQIKNNKEPDEENASHKIWWAEGKSGQKAAWCEMY